MGKKSFLILASIFFTLSFSVAATGALLPTLADYFNEDAILTGRLVWIYMLPYGLFALVWSPLSRRFSIKRILITCLFIFSLGAFLVSAASRLNTAFLGRLIMGIFGSSFVPLSLIIIGKELPPQEKSRYVGWFFSISFLSSLLGVFLSGIIMWRYIYLLPAALSLILGIISFFHLKDFNYTVRFRISYVNTFKNKDVLKLFIFIFASSLLYHSIQQWLAVFMRREYSFSQFSISSVFTIASLTAIISEGAGGMLVKKFIPQNISFWGFISMSIFLFLLILSGFSKVIFFIIILWGGGWALTHLGFSTKITYLPDEFLRDSASLNSSVRFFSGGLGAFLGGKSIASFGFKTHFFIIALLVLFLGLIVKRT